MKYYFTFYIDNFIGDLYINREFNIKKVYNSTPAFIYKNYTEKFIKFYELCFLSFVQNSNNKDCKILVDDKARHIFKKYSTLSNKYFIKQELPVDIIKNYIQVWSLPKLYAFNHVCNLGDPFAFFDLDIIMIHDLDENFLKKDIFVYNIVPKEDIYPSWNYEPYINLIKTQNKKNSIIYSLLENVNFDFKKITIPNTGIFGGTNLDKINSFLNIAIDHCLDPVYSFYWKDDFLDKNSYTKACILEQFTLGLLHFNPSLNQNTDLTFVTSYYKENFNSLPPINHVLQDKNLIKNNEFSPEILYSLIYKMYKDILTLNKININNFSNEEKILLSKIKG